MKVVKLDRRFRQYKQHGHVVGVRCDNWAKEGQHLEQLCRDKLGGKTWRRDNCWYSYFGKENGRGNRPYWITFRKEAHLTFVLLSARLTK